MRAAIPTKRRGPLLALLAAFTLFPVVATAAPPVPPADYDGLMAAARAARDRGDWQETLGLLEKAYVLKPSPALLNNVGRALEETGRYEEAHAAYTKVANDSTAGSDVRALDAARAGALESRLGRGWVIVEADGAASVDGHPSQVAARTEFAAAPGRRLFGLQSPTGESTTLWTVDVPKGRRVVIRPPTEKLGVVRLDGARAGFRTLTLDGTSVVGDLNKLKRLLITPGSYRVDATFSGAPDRRLTVVVELGREAVVAALLPEVVRIPEKPPEQTGLSRAGKWQLWIGLTGLALAGVGTWLLIDAADRRDQVENAHANEIGLVDGITRAEALSLAEDVDIRTAAGASVLALGLAAGLGAATWAIVEQTSEPSVHVSAGLDGLFYVGGRF